MKTVLTQTLTETIIGFNLNAIRNTQLFFLFLEWAKDEELKKPWIKAGLLNNKYAAALQARLEKANIEKDFKYTMEEAIQMYTCIDISCRFYLSAIGEQMRNKMVETGKTTHENLDKEQKFTLGSAQNIILQLKEAMNNYPRFKQAVAELTKLPIVDFESYLLDDNYNPHDEHGEPLN